MVSWDFREGPPAEGAIEGEGNVGERPRTMSTHFYATDGSQNACKAVQVYQTLLTGSWNGKQRGDFPPAPTHKVRKHMLKRPAGPR